MSLTTFFSFVLHSISKEPYSSDLPANIQICPS
uniref:Uncharacterized protein n=1 Tax=Tetranychus urticae TaxID=32264 RepID=T1KVS3_TETUR